jgi:hypothetical protein
VTSTTTTYAVRPPGRAAYARRGVVLLLALGALVGAGAAPCWACSCVTQTTAEQVASADAIFIGLVSGRKGPSDTGRSDALVAYYATVSSVYKGAIPSEIRVSSVASGGSCGLEGISTGGTYLFFATGSPGAWSASLCGGTTTDVAAVGIEVQSIVGPATTPTATPAASDVGQLATDETPSGPSQSGLVLVLALVTGGLAILALARRGRPPRGKDPE